MTVETGALLPHQLNKDYPFSTDFISEGDDHLRLIKKVLLNAFEGVDEPLKTYITKLANPVGTIAIFADGTDPNTTIGGTWVRFGEDKIMLSAGTVHKVGETGGAEKFKLTKAQLPAEKLPLELTIEEAGAHKHIQSEVLHYKGGAYGGTTTGQTSYRADSDSATNTYHPYTSTEPAHNHTISGTTEALGTGDDISIMQPFVVVNVWQRTK